MTPPLPIRHHEPLATKTTFGVGGPARAYAEIKSDEQLQAVIDWARTNEQPIFVLGGGSNVIVHDDGVQGVVLRLQDDRVEFEVGPNGSTLVTAQAGLSWDELVVACGQRGLWGIEALSGIPGSVGAAPVQNIGAYGQELSDTLVSVRVQSLHDGAARTLPADELALGYRTSRLREAGEGFVVRAITLRLATTPGPRPRIRQIDLSPCTTPTAVRERVLQARADRGMLWPAEACPFGNVGSFFVNPVLAREHADALVRRSVDLVAHPVPGGAKVPAAWLIEHAGFVRGHRFAEVAGRVGLSPRHALALVNRGGASARDVLVAAYAVHDAVLRQFGVALQPEARFVHRASLASGSQASWPDRPLPLAAAPPGV